MEWPRSAGTGGFVWIYSALHYITNGGADIRLAQYLFAGLYLAVLALVLAIYSHSPRVPRLILVPMRGPWLSI